MCLSVQKGDTRKKVNLPQAIQKLNKPQTYMCIKKLLTLLLKVSSSGLSPQLSVSNL